MYSTHGILTGPATPGQSVHKSNDEYATFFNAPG